MAFLRKSARWLWDKISSADTVQWLYSLLPAGIRRWLQEQVRPAVVSSMLTAGTVVVGVLRSIDPYYLLVGSIVTLVLSLWFVNQVRNSFREWKARRQAFTVEAISGPLSGMFLVRAGGKGPLAPQTVYARLEVKSHRFLKNCTATVIGAWEVNMPSRPLMKLARYQRQLYWTPESEKNKMRDLTPDVPRLLDVAVLDQERDPGVFHLVCADNEPRDENLPGWYKIQVLLASESEDAVRQTVDLKIGLGHRKYPPPPLVLYLWRDGDEKRVEYDD